MKKLLKTTIEIKNHPMEMTLKQVHGDLKDQQFTLWKMALMKSLTLAQMSTASMGRFDRKAGKNEPDAPTS